MNIALLSPNRDAYSETFIHAHKQWLKGNISFYYGEIFFLHLESQGYLIPKSFFRRALNNLLSRYVYKLSLFEYLLFKSFKKQKIQLVFAEFGTSGTKVLNVCKKLRLPLVVHFHGYDAYVKNVLAENKLAYADMFAYASKLIVVSRHMKDQLIHLGCPAEKLVLNVYGPDPSFFSADPLFIESKFVAVGRFVDKKAPYYLILAFKKVIEKHPDATLVIGGDGPLYEACSNMVNAMKLQKSISLPGKVSREQFLKLLGQANGFVQHSITASSGDCEGTPVAILEAMAASLPVVSTRHTGIGELIIDGETGWLVDEHDIDAMTDRIISLLENKEFAKKMGRKGRELVKQQYTIVQHVEKLNEVIAQSITSYHAADFNHHSILQS